MGEMKRIWELFTFDRPEKSPEEDHDRVFLGITPEKNNTGGDEVKAKKLKKENKRLRRKLERERLRVRELEVETAELQQAWDITHDLLEEAWDALAALNQPSNLRNPYEVSE